MMTMRADVKQHDSRTRFQKFFGFCPQCGKWLHLITTYRQHTAYEDDERNFFTGCKRCCERNDEYWEEMWNDYYSGPFYGRG